MSMIKRPVEVESADHPMTLSDVEALCRIAREQGGSDDDLITVAVFPGLIGTRLRVWGARITVRLDHNREAAYRKDHEL